MSDGCRHGNGPPSRCSQCLGAPVRRVDQQGAEVTIDGVRAGRLLDIEALSAQRYYAKRGAHARHQTRSKK